MEIGVPGATVPTGSGATVGGAGEVLRLTFSVTDAFQLVGPTAVVRFYQGHGVDGPAVAGAHFGAALGALGNYFVAGAPDETVHGKRGAGFWGSLGHPQGRFGPNPFYSQSGTVAGEHLGTSFASGGGPGSDGSGTFISMVGAPGMTIAGHRGAGAIELDQYDVNDEADATLGWAGMLTQNSDGIPGKAATNAHFGAAVSAGGRNDNVGAIGVPGQTVRGHKNAGAVIVIHTIAVTYKIDATYTLLTQATPHVPGFAEGGDHFGAAVAFMDLTAANGFERRLVVGDPDEDVGHDINTGAVELFHLTPADHLSLKGVTLVQSKHPRSGLHYGGGILEELF
jgi:hypothetical protein